MVDDAKRRRRAPYNGTVSPDRFRWMRTEGLEFIHYKRGDGEKEKGEGSQEGWGESHILTMVQKTTKNQFTIDLTELTYDELNAVEAFMRYMFAAAREICELRDRLAEEAFDNGDNTYFRIYRPVPEVVERPRPKR